jgi:hypothetical protein
MSHPSPIQEPWELVLTVCPSTACDEYPSDRPGCGPPTPGLAQLEATLHLPEVWVRRFGTGRRGVRPGVLVGYRHLLHEPGGRLVLLTPAG